MRNIVVTPLLFASLFTLVYSCRIKNLYCHFISFGLLYYLLHSHVYLHCHRCFSFSIFTLPAAGLSMTLYDSFLLYFTQRLRILYHLLFFYLPLLSAQDVSFPFPSFFSHNCDTYLLFLLILLLVYSIAYMYFV